MFQIDLAKLKKPVLAFSCLAVMLTLYIQLFQRMGNTTMNNKMLVEKHIGAFVNVR